MASTFTPTVITSNSGVNNVFTNIPLANSATTTIQNISTFANGEGGVLTGVVKIDATTDYVFGFEISFTKDTAGVINHSVRYFAGDIPTLALFTIGVSGQDIQITLGSHAGFVNSSARFQMMASAASPGVQVSASNVTNDGSADSPRGWAISTNADYTFSTTGTSRVRATATSANRSVTLPTTGIKAGYCAEVVSSCSGGFTLAIKSSDTTTVETLKGSKGRILLIALQDTPTTPAHWDVAQIEDRGTWTPRLTGTGGGVYTASGLNGGVFTRIGNTVTLHASVQWSAAPTPYTGNLIVADAPFANASQRCAGQLQGILSGSLVLANHTFGILIDPSSNFVYILGNQVGTSSYSHLSAVATSGTIYGFTISYIVL